MEVPADAVSVPHADTKLAERWRQSQVDRLLAKSAKIAAPILAKQAAIPTTSNPSQAAEGKKKNREKEKQPERLSEKDGRKQAEEAPNKEDEDVITLKVTPEEMNKLFCEPSPSAKENPTLLPLNP